MGASDPNTCWRRLLLPNPFSGAQWISLKLVVNWHMLFAATCYASEWLCDCISALRIGKGISMPMCGQLLGCMDVGGHSFSWHPTCCKHVPASCQHVGVGIGWHTCNMDGMHSSYLPPPGSHVNAHTCAVSHHWCLSLSALLPSHPVLCLVPVSAHMIHSILLRSAVSHSLC